MRCSRVPLELPAAFTASLSYVTSGLFMGWNTPMLPRLQEPASHIVLSADEASWLGALGALALVPPILLAASLADVVGRRWMLLASAPPFLAAAIWQRFATTFWELLVASLLASVGIGFVMPIAPVYLADIAKDSRRGMLIIFGSMMSSCGGLLMNSIAPYVSFFTMCEITMVFPVAFAASYWWMPESPYHLLAKGRPDDAQTSLMRLRGKSSEKEVREELDSIQRVVRDSCQDRRATVADAIRELGRSAVARKSFVVVVAFSTLNALCGAPAMGVYVTQIFLWSGSSLDSSVSTIVVTAIQVASSLGSSLLVDRAGRRPLLVLAYAASCAALLAEGAFFYIKEAADPALADTLFWLPLTALVVFFLVYNFGASSLVWVLGNELVPDEIRGLTNSFIAAWNAVITFGSIKLFQVVATSLGTYVPFWFFAADAVGALAFTWFLIPETKGRSLGEINAEMRAKGDEQAPCHIVGAAKV